MYDIDFYDIISLEQKCRGNAVPDCLEPHNEDGVVEV